MYKVRYIRSDLRHGVMLILQSKIISEVQSTIKSQQACHATKVKKNVYDLTPQ